VTTTRTANDPAGNNPAPYTFDNDNAHAVDQHDCLAAILDDSTIQRLSALGDLTGRRCLEVGAGGGSIARWLADRVGHGGRVTATDVNTRHIPSHQRLRVVHHDITTDALPDPPYDLIHARLVLLHLPQRLAVLASLAAALAPGGVLLVEEWHTEIRDAVLAAPTKEAKFLFETYHDTLVARIFAARGHDPGWARQVHAEMLDVGLVDVDTVVTARSWPGGSPGTRLAASNLEHLRSQFLAAGMTGEQIDELRGYLYDPRLVVRGNLTYSTLGRRPARS
jgi:2-polyprenyl-3-methyl-5-hydroxy-6-metoxy-1,4-benzoquinol methylase